MRGWSARLSAFERVQLFLVLWLAVTSFIYGGAGVTFAGYREVPLRALALTPDVVLLHVANAALQAVFAFGATRRFPLWDRPGHAAVRHLGVLLALLVITRGGDLVQGWLGDESPYTARFYLLRSLEYGVYTLFAHGMLYGEHRHRREREELRLRAEMADSAAAHTRARVRALRMEWSPHFLTETLEAIGGLLPGDVAGAKRMLLGLGSVLRRVLSQARTGSVRLEREMELVDEVLRLEGMRRPSLVVEREIDDGAWELPVPPMALLTLVCEALGRVGAAAPARLRISAAADGEGVRLRVEASGAEGAGAPLELRCAPEPELVERPAAREAAGSVPPPQAPAPGERLEFLTYAILVALNTLLALHGAWARTAAGEISLAAPAGVYVAGSGLYAALWWGSFALAARWLTAWRPIRQERWPRRLGLHAAGAVLLALANAVVYWPFQFYLVHGGSVLIGLRARWEWGDLAVYPPLAGIAHGFAYAREYQARRLSELRLRSQLAESELERTGAELRALKAELNPHFLFNALNTVSSLMHTHPGEARRVVAHLSALLRRVLESSSLQEVSVQEEVEFIRLYLEIEQARFGDALRVEYRLDPATLRARVPHLLIQPLVENAVKHGLRPRGGAGRVTLSTRREGDFLQLTVVDDGVGPSPVPRPDGTGLANVRARLRELYGEAHAFELAPAPAGGAQARVRIPFTEHPRTLATA